MDFQMIKGSVSMMVLGLLNTSDMYGYQIIRELSERSNDTFMFKEGTLYPVLHELEKKMLIESYWESTTLKRKRKYYLITEKGRIALLEKIEDWENVVISVERVIESLNRRKDYE